MLSRLSATLEFGVCFPSPRKDGDHIRIEIRRACKDVCHIAAITELRIHDLRHSFASFAVQGGTSLPIIGGLLGHSGPAVTSRHAHLNDDAMRAAAERVGAIVGKKTL